MERNLWMMANNPLVSVIIPVYNAASYIEESVRSVLVQTWRNIEIIVVDDGSTDNSIALLQEFKSEKLTLVRQPNKGASAARNNGLQHAKGKYIQFLDADDLLSKDKIEAQVALLALDEDQLALCGTVYFNDGENPFGRNPVREWYSKDSDDPVDFLLKLYAGSDVMPGYGGMVQPNAWLTPRKLIDKAGRWREFRCPDDDGEFFCRVILAGKGIRYADNGINYYRKYNSGKSWSGQRSRNAVENMLQAIDSKYYQLGRRGDKSFVDRIFGKHYWELGVAAYPAYKDISAVSIRKARQLKYRGERYRSGKLATLLSRIFGWKIIRILSYLKHGSVS